MESLLNVLDEYGYAASVQAFIDSLTASLIQTGIMIAIAFVLGLVATIVLFIVFMPEKKEKNLKGFPLQLHRFLNFKGLITTGILKFIYVLVSMSVIISHIISIFSSNFFATLIGLIIELVIIRVVFELTMLIILLTKNVIEINNRLKDNNKSDDMLKNDIDINKTINKTINKQDAQHLQVQLQQTEVSPKQAEAPSQKSEASPQQTEAQPQYPKFCRICGSPIDQTTGKCPNCDK